MDPTWPILPDVVTRHAYASKRDAPVSDTARVGSSLFGHGLLRPFRRDGLGDFVSGDGAELVRAAVGLVLGTTCNSHSTFGELPWRPEFGSLLHQLHLRNNDAQLEHVARNLVAMAIDRWVPAARVTQVNIVRKGHAMFVRVTYDVRDASGTRVLVPGLQTAVALG